MADDGRDAAGTPSSDAGTERSTPDDLRTSRRKSIVPSFLFFFLNIISLVHLHLSWGIDAISVTTSVSA